MKFLKVMILLLLVEVELVNSALIENSTEILIAGEMNNFTLVLSCDGCEVELLKEVKTLYRSTEITSFESERIIESSRETRENSLINAESLTRGSEIKKEIEEDNCGCVYRDERGGEIPLKKNKEVTPKVIRGEADRDYDETEEEIQLKEGNFTTRELSREGPQERREIQEEAFYERVPFVVLGPAKKKGNNVTFQLYVPDGVEGAFWIPVKVDDEVEYIGVLILSFEKDWVEESEAEKETYGELGTTEERKDNLWLLLLIIFGFPAFWTLRVIGIAKYFSLEEK